MKELCTPLFHHVLPTLLIQLVNWILCRTASYSSGRWAWIHEKLPGSSDGCHLKPGSEYLKHVKQLNLAGCQPLILQVSSFQPYLLTAKTAKNKLGLED